MRIFQYKGLVKLLIIIYFFVSFYLITGDQAWTQDVVDEVDSTFKPDGAFLQGLEISTYLSQEIGLIDNDELLERINNIGYEVAYWASEPGKLYSFNLVDMKEPNAFALPGGFIFLTKGMMEIDLTDDELAMLLGHEIAHVKLNHIAKMQRRSGLLSMLQQVLLVGALVGMKDQGTQYRGPVDPRRDPEYLSPSGKWAVVQGLATFGTLFRNLLELGFSRTFEFEADHHGFLYATRAGYAIEALEGLMMKLHTHIYETPGVGYWRTHPYFNDRIDRARAKKNAEYQRGEKSPEVFYRQRSQADFLNAALELNKTAENYPEKEVFLQTLAFQAHPKGNNTDWILHNILTSKRLKEQKKPLLTRDYGVLIKNYEHAVKLLTSQKRTGTHLDTIEKELKDLDQERQDLLPRYIEILDRDNVSIPLLKAFVSNYSNHKRIAEAYVRLGENYRLASEIKESAKALLKVKSLECDEIWLSRVDNQLRLLIPQIKDPSLCMELIQEASDKDRLTLAEQMKIIINDHLSLENISTFFDQWAQSEYITDIQKQLEQIAEREYNRGRILEAASEYQKSLDAYNKVVTYASQTQFGKLAQSRIDIIQDREIE